MADYLLLEAFAEFKKLYINVVLEVLLIMSIESEHS